MAEKSPPTNVQELTVSELSGALKRVIEDRFALVRVRGEISGYRGPHSSGHAYFSIKDASARIDAVIWKGVFGRMRVRPEEGLEVIATGKVTTFAGKSTYQLVVESLEPAGAGALMAMLEERRRRLAGEGLFDAGRKQLLPFLPRCIGVITSPTGAVIRDILHRLAERCPVHVLVWPVRVQGETSAAEVTAAIVGFNALPEGGAIPRPDILIVARGGGSLEDLWGFNDEALVRAAAASMIPLVSAVGHETDWTLLDHAADVRAPTPTAAAEMAVPVRAELLATLDDLLRRHRGATTRRAARQRSDLRGLARALPTGEGLLSPLQQRCDMLASRLASGLRGGLDAATLRLGRMAARLAMVSPHASLARDRARLSAVAQRQRNARAHALDRKQEALARLATRFATACGQYQRLTRQRIGAQQERLARLALRLPAAISASVERRRAALAGQDLLLRSLGYTNVLARGFVLVRNADGAPLRLASDVAPGMALGLQFADGQVAVTAAAGSTGPARKRGGPWPGQKTLFDT